MIEDQWRQSDAPTGRWKRLGAGRAKLVGSIVAAACIFGGVTSALAQSGEDEESTQLSGADACPAFGLDSLVYCFARQGSQPGDCELFDVSSPYTLLGTLLCPTRNVLATPELQPLEGSVEDHPIQAMSDGWLRSLQIDGESEPTYTVTQFLGPNADTVVVSEDPISVPGDCDGPQPQALGGADSAAFCSALEDALPKQQVSGGEIVLAIGYNYDDLMVNPNGFMTVWGCGGRQAKCISGSPASLDDNALGATVLNQIWLLVIRSHTHTRIYR